MITIKGYDADPSTLRISWAPFDSSQPFYLSHGLWHLSDHNPVFHQDTQKGHGSKKGAQLTNFWGCLDCLSIRGCGSYKQCES